MDPLGLGRREALLLAMVTTGVWAVAGAEVLSLGHHLHFGPVVAWWAVPAALLSLAAWRGRKQLRGAWPPPRADRGTMALAACAGAILLVTGYVAATCPTNTWDCWAYHLPRVFYWVQAGSVEHFPAHDRRQLEMPPMAEFLSAHWRVLSGGDGWGNMHQWFAFVGCALGASVVARELGAAARGQSLAALLMVTNAAAATQASNGKNDIVVALWALILVYLGARVWNQRSCGWARALVIGATLGLLVLTKGTGLVIAPVLCAGIGVAMLVAARWKGLALGAAVALVAISVNLPHWSRNYTCFGSPLGLPESKHGYPLANTVHAPGAVASNVLRNLALHTATPSERINNWIARKIAGAHKYLGVGPNDPRTTMQPEAYPFRIATWMYSDGNNPAPVHILLAFGLLAAVAVRPRLLRSPLEQAAFCLPYAAFLLFCILLRWQPWHMRLHIPILALLAPVGGLLLPRLPVAPLKSAVVLAALGLVWINMAWALVRPLIGARSVLLEDRTAAFFHDCSWVREPLEQAGAAAEARGPRLAATCMRESPWEYAVIDTLRRTLGPDVPIQDFHPNFGPRPGPTYPAPDVVIVAEPCNGPLIQYDNHVLFVPVAHFSPFGLYIPAAKVQEEVEREAARSAIAWKAVAGSQPAARGNLFWGESPGTTITFQSDGSQALLLLECKRSERQDQRAVVKLNGREVWRCEFGPVNGFVPVRVPLETREGENLLELEYAPEPGGKPPVRTVVFRRFQIVSAG